MLRVVPSAISQLEKVQGGGKSEDVREFEKDDEEAAKYNSCSPRACKLVGAAIFVCRFAIGTLDS
jgi:hypothetical protein